MVDESKIAFNPAVEISYLEQENQRVLLSAMEMNDCTPSHAQAIRLKKLSQEGVLESQMIYEVMAEQKPNQQEQIKFRRDEFQQYFPPKYSNEQMRKDILKGLELLKRQRERNRDARWFELLSVYKQIICTMERTASTEYHIFVGAGLSVYAKYT